MSCEIFSRAEDDIQRLFDVAALRSLAEALPLQHVTLKELQSSFECDCWGDIWTPAKVAAERRGPHWQPDADLTDPLLIDPDGWVADGNHRLATHAALGTELIPVKRFETFEAMSAAEIFQ